MVRSTLMTCLKKDISPGWFLIPFEDIAHKIQEYLPRWLKYYQEYEPTFNLYFTVTTNRYMHLEGGSCSWSTAWNPCIEGALRDDDGGGRIQHSPRHHPTEHPGSMERVVKTNLNYANEFSSREGSGR